MSRKNTPHRVPGPLLLLILDGWGWRDDGADNAIFRAPTPNWDRLWSAHTHGLLTTSGPSVGLPPGQMGNSEVGHMTIGAGRVIEQELTRIGRALAGGELARHPAFAELAAALAASGGALHLLGLLSPGGVHSHEDHLYGLLEIGRDLGIERQVVHAILDGRDMPPRSALASLARLETYAAEHPGVTVATITGRFYAMDRDRRWERTAAAWQAIVEADAERRAETATGALAMAYELGEDDEFVTPTVLAGGTPIADGDGVLMFNFRADRARQMAQAFALPGFTAFPGRRPRLAGVLTMSEYQDGLTAKPLFRAQPPDHLLADEIAAAGLAQLRLAETEKYAHVTYFFNGGRETPVTGEERCLIPSPKVKTYDLKPEMSAPELGAALVAAIGGRRYPFIAANVANPDMVGHTGNWPAALAAVGAVDTLLGQVLKALDDAGGEMLLTADHGNIEQMADPENGQPHTAHTLNPVPYVYYGRPATARPAGSLTDIAPTVLTLLGLPVPAAMTGRSLLRLD